MLDKICIKDIDRYTQQISENTLVLKRTIQNIKNYTHEIVDNDLILTAKHTNITVDQINKECFTKSIILYALITTAGDTHISNNGTYFGILEDIWMSMPIQKILQNTSFDIKLTEENGHQGFWWKKNLNFSIRMRNANEILKEIIKMVQISDYRLIMTIQLTNHKIIKFDM